MNQAAAIYTRVSSDRQKESDTIASQTAALVEYAKAHGYAVPPEWIFQDEGYSGASLVRPGLEALRDLAAQGQITTVLIYSPDRLSRKYAYQVLLGEELSRCGVEVVFLKSPAGSSPEDQLVVQFQGMIAEYERAQIAERSRRGKRYKAQQGVVNVLSGAPYGYQYMRKTDTSAAYYEVIESEAGVVRMVFRMYTQQGLSINAIARSLNKRGISTRTRTTRWERSVVWAMLRNPAYEGKACYGKTEQSPRQRITRPLRQKNGISNRTNCHRERPRAEGVAEDEQASFSPQNDRADTTSRDAGLPTVWLCFVSVLHTHVEAKAVLLSVSRRGCLPAAQGCAVQESSRPVRLFGQIRVGPNRLLVGRWNADASRNGPTQRNRPKYRSATATQRSIAQ